MKVIKALLILSIPLTLAAQDVYRGADFLRRSPGDTWIMDMYGKDGPAPLYTKYSIDENMNPASRIIPITIENFFMGQPNWKKTISYEVQSDGSVKLGTSIVDGTIQNYAPPNTFLPPKFEVGTTWSYRIRNGDINTYEVLEVLEKIYLPDNLVIEDVIKTRRGWENTSMIAFEYFARGKGHVATKTSDGHWVTLLRKK